MRMSPEAALQILLGDAAPSLLRPATQQVQAFAIPERAETVPSVSTLKVVVKRGETVNGLLRRHLGNSVFSLQFQRQALVRLNPSVFQKGLVQRLAVGTTLWIPTDPIMASLVPGSRKDSALLQPSPTTEPLGKVIQQVHTPSSTRGWVRFP
jgi:Tfp pilus assembly protein FimV